MAIVNYSTCSIVSMASSQKGNTRVIYSVMVICSVMQVYINIYKYRTLHKFSCFIDIIKRVEEMR